MSMSGKWKDSYSGHSKGEFENEYQWKSNKKGHTVYMKTDDMLYFDGNGRGLSFYIKSQVGIREMGFYE